MDQGEDKTAETLGGMCQGLESRALLTKGSSIDKRAAERSEFRALTGGQDQHDYTWCLGGLGPIALAGFDLCSLRQAFLQGYLGYTSRTPDGACLHIRPRRHNQATGFFPFHLSLVKLLQVVLQTNLAQPLHIGSDGYTGDHRQV